MTEPVAHPRPNWKLRAAAAVLWLAIAVLGVLTHGSPIAIAAGVGLALIFAYRARQAYTATHRSPGT